MNQNISISQTNPANIYAQLGIRIGVLLASLMSLIQWLLLGFYGWKIPPEIPLFHSAPLGAGQLAGKVWFLIIPIVSLLFIIISLIFIRLSKNLPSIFNHIIVWGTTLNIFLSVIVMVHIIYLVL